MVRVLQEFTDCRREEVYRTGEMLDLKALMQLATMEGFEDLKNQPWPPQAPAGWGHTESIFEALQERDLLLYHPYENFEPVIRLVEEAADDPNVIAIKQVLYRTAEDSRIMAALIRAAEQGKQVTVVIELKARFDEAHNLAQAEDLEVAGAQVIYGVRRLKTHAKACLIVRKEGGRIRRYTHFGTGNYNETTARLYTDVSYLTCRQDFGADASAFFNVVTGRSQVMGFQNLVPAPQLLAPTLIRLIEEESARAEAGEHAMILAKMNGLQDRGMIDHFYSASQRGVTVKLNVRGICCLRPGVIGLSENIEVVSIIDRYLEHARIFYFHNGGKPQVYISSADLMSRNLHKRVELLVPVEDVVCREKLIALLKRHFDDTSQSYRLMPDGSYEKLEPDSGEAPFRVQEFFSWEARETARRVRMEQENLLEPHRPSPGDQKLAS
ncbi:MAG: polyphosphate kinase 1 [Verrucomicrobiota bacterium]